MKKATFAAGCFWGVEAAFTKLKGVVSTEVGYMGGNLDNPSYEDVCTDKTGHIEVVQIEYDPSVISYDNLLDVFWNIHDPNQKNRQGSDIGTQYKSVIFYHDENQHKKAIKSKKSLQESKKYNKTIQTEIKPVQKFWKAEEYHQKYFEKNSNSACRLNH